MNAMELNAIRQFVHSDKTATTYKTQVVFIMNAIPDLNAGNEPLLFVPSRWLQEGRLAEVLEVLADRSAATQRSYIAAVCKYLSALSHEHTVYHAELAALLKVAQVAARINKAASDEAADDVDLHAIHADSRTPLCVRGLIQLIQCGVQLKLSQLIGRTVKDVVRALPEGTALCISNLYPGDSALFIGNRTVKAVEGMFRRYVGMSYWRCVKRFAPEAAASASTSTSTAKRAATDAVLPRKKKVVQVQQPLSPPESIDESEPEPESDPYAFSSLPRKKPVVIRRKAATETALPPFPRKKPVIHRKAETTAAETASYAPWDTPAYSKGMQESSVQLQRKNVMKLQKVLNCPHNDGFDWKLFSKPESFEKVKAYLRTPASDGGKGFKLNTQRNYLSTLCKYLECTPGLDASVHSRYFQLQSEVDRELSQEEQVAERKDVIPYEELAPTMKRLLGDPNVPSYVRVLCAVVVADVELDADGNVTAVVNNNGVLRPSDLMDTTFTQTQNSALSFFDIEQARWHISSEHTKNKKERELSVPELARYMRSIYGEQLPAYMIVNSAGERMQHSYASKTFKKYAGVPFTDCRKAYINYRMKKGLSMAERHTLTVNMGHTVKTAIMDYEAASAAASIA